MPNPLQTAMPPPPDVGAMTPQSGSSPPQGAPAPAQAPTPPPTHQQTVAALQHFDAIESELTALLRDPDIGKADMKSKIIDGTTKLVANRIITPSDAVGQLGSVPKSPFDQKKWLETHYQQTVMAADAVLQHHGAGFGGQNVDSSAPDPDSHTDMMSGLVGQYRGGANG